tara:strand:+ start:10608 stop:10736 length:129 start_codon:yes stop_codon:yes gene_type:complete
MNTKTVYISTKTHKALKALSAKTGVKIAALAEQAVKLFLQSK